MALTQRSFEDVAIDNALLIFEVYVTTQKQAYLAVNPGATAEEQTAAVGFRVDRDRLRAYDDESLLIQPIVILGFDSEVPNGGTKIQKHSTATFYADCIVTKGEVSNGLNVSGDRGANARLLYLKSQVEAAWFNLANYHMGFAVGTIARKPWGRWQTTTSIDEGMETWTVSGRWTFELDYEWALDSPQGVALDEISVDSRLWSGLYDYPII